MLMSHGPFRSHLSHPRRDSSVQDALHLDLIRHGLNAALEVLRLNAPPDTFIGRKTQEPFPKEDES